MCDMHQLVKAEGWKALTLAIDACTIVHRSIEVARAAKRIPAHRLDPHAEFDAGVFWKLAAMHPNPVRLVLSRHQTARGTGLQCG